MSFKKELVELGVHAALKTAPANYSAELVGKSFLEELKKEVSDYDSYRRHSLDVFELLQDIFNEVLPKKVDDRYNFLAETMFLQHGQKQTFKRKLGRARAKTFITKVGLGGVFETFRLDSDTFEVPVHAIGGAATIDFERLLSGAEDIAEAADILMLGIEERISQMLCEALQDSISTVGRPSNTVKTDTNFTKASFDSLITGVRSYGDPIIVCTPEFADQIPATTVGSSTAIADQDINDMRNFGVLRMYKGCPIVVIPQSYTDETNEVKVFDPKYCYIIPGMGSKIARLIFEGGVIVDEFKNKDRSIELSAYQKVGCAILSTNNWAIYKVTSIS